jgi:purine-binding chemotaxis protein CheW
VTEAFLEDDERAVVVRVGEAQFGVDVRHVREVLRLPAVTRLPFPPPTILGIVSVRGTLVPVMDLGLRLLDAPANREGRLVVVWDPESEGVVGLLVDEVLDLVPLHATTHDAPPEVTASLPEGWIRSVLAPDADRLVTLLDLPRVLDVPTPAAEESR